jgi:tricarballylate dehydrogenase
MTTNKTQGVLNETDVWDVVVVGAGNAAFAAAVSAKEHGAKRVLVLEKADKKNRGGNTFFSGGLFRFAFDKTEQLLEIAPEVKDLEGFLGGVETYPASAFWDDMLRVSGGRADPELGKILIDNSFDTVRWMARLGIKMEAAVTLGGVVVDGKIKWPKGTLLRAEHEGVGLSTSWFRIAEKKGIVIVYSTCAEALLRDKGGAVAGLTVRGPDGIKNIKARAVVLGAGGFEASQSWRAQYLGRPWDGAKVRGTRHNQGDGLRMAMEIGALPIGQWSGCHATPINAEAPAYGVAKLTDKTNRLSYPYGVMINRDGLRFVDEAENFWSFTYAKFGGIILNQPESIAYQIYDQKTIHLLEKRYSTSEPVVAGSLDALIDKLPISREVAKKTLREFNAAAGHGNFNPGVLDGMRTEGLALRKSNWAQKLDKGPYVCYPVTGGITFTFGGLKISEHGQVLDTGWRPIERLFCCGEMVGNIFHYNYPGGTGLVSGAVFGRIAGASAGKTAARK